MALGWKLEIVTEKITIMDWIWSEWFAVQRVSNDHPYQYVAHWKQLQI
jgi:hypothetical protein